MAYAKKKKLGLSRILNDRRRREKEREEARAEELRDFYFGDRHDISGRVIPTREEES